MLPSLRRIERPCSRGRYNQRSYHRRRNPFMSALIRIDHIEVDQRLHDFVTREAVPGTGIDAAEFWRGFAALVRRLAPRNAALMERRDLLQSQIDAWHLQHPGAEFDRASYNGFLAQIGYLEPDQGPFSVATAQVDPEISQIAGP